MPGISQDGGRRVECFPIDPSPVGLPLFSARVHEADESGHDRVDTIAAAPRDAIGRCATRRWPELVHLDSLSKPASAGYDRPAERRPDSVRPYGSLLQSRGSSSGGYVAEAERGVLCLRPSADARSPANRRVLCEARRRRAHDAYRERE